MCCPLLSTRALQCDPPRHICLSPCSNPLTTLPMVQLTAVANPYKKSLATIPEKSPNLPKCPNRDSSLFATSALASAQDSQHLYVVIR